MQGNGRIQRTEIVTTHITVCLSLCQLQVQFSSHTEKSRCFWSAALLVTLGIVAKWCWHEFELITHPMREPMRIYRVTARTI